MHEGVNPLLCDGQCEPGFSEELGARGFGQLHWLYLLDLSLVLGVSNQQPTDRHMRPRAAQNFYECGPTNLVKTLLVFV